MVLGGAGLLQLSKKVIDLDELRMLAAQGVPDAAGVRATVWKVIDWLELPVFLAFVLWSEQEHQRLRYLRS